MSDKKHFRVYIPRIIGALIAAVAIYFIVKSISDLLGQKPARNEKKIQPITLLKPPPPPPPPPPKVEKPPEPEIKEKIEEPEPEPMPETPPDEAPARDLGLDAEGTAGSDGFGLAARKGGTGLFGGSGNPYAGYGGMVKNGILNYLSSHEELRRKGYTAVVKVWLKADGAVERVELAKGSNDAEIDELLTRLLNKFDRVAEPPPPGMPQPVKLKISSRV